MWPLEVLSLQKDEREASGQDSQGSLGPGACGLRTTEVLPWASQGALVVKNLPANAGDATDMGSISGLGRSPGEGNDNPLQYSCLENPKDRGAWQATVHRVKKESDTTEHTYTHTHTHTQAEF